jgi:hypothetical protein
MKEENGNTAPKKIIRDTKVGKPLEATVSRTKGT